LAVTSHAMS